MNSKKFYFFLISLIFLAHAVLALNISSDPYDHWAWNDDIGWIDFYYDNIEIDFSQLSGYASSSVGIISFSCDETGNPDGENYCGLSTYYVKNDGEGNLSGWAWNDKIGWISFSCKDETGITDYDVCATSSYKVWIEKGDDNKGHFRGWAWNDKVGWICFNCVDIELSSNDSDYCETVSDFEVVTDWIPPQYATSGELLSLIIDTETPKATLTGVVWKGEVPTGCDVKFYLGSSDSTDPDSFAWTGPYGYERWESHPEEPDKWYEVSIPDSDLEFHNKHRYLRYKIILKSDPLQLYSPKVEKVVLLWMK